MWKGCGDTMNRQLWHWPSVALKKQDSNQSWAVLLKRWARSKVFIFAPQQLRGGHTVVLCHDFNTCFSFGASGDSRGLAS
jgi:hypothetical protein